MHYQRWRTTGSPGGAALLRNPLPARECSIDGCQRPARARGWCNTHHARWLTHGDALAALAVKPNRFLPGSENPNWKGDDVGYVAIHTRLRQSHSLGGPCAICGAIAVEFAYDNADVNERYSIVSSGGRPGVMVYSLDPSHYFASCHSCHMKFDAAYRKSLSPFVRRWRSRLRLRRLQRL